MEVTLPFANVRGIKSKIGCPQGMQWSVWSFIQCLSEVMTRVQAKMPGLSYLC